MLFHLEVGYYKSLSLAYKSWRPMILYPTNPLHHFVKILLHRSLV
jgi:hypothetical protein